jgi:protein TonB
MMARDDYDARRWRDEVGDARERLTNSRSVVLNAVNDTSGDTATTSTAPIQNAVAAAPASSGPAPMTNKPAESAPVFKPVPENTAPKTTAPSETAVARTDKPLVPNIATPEPKPAEQKPAANENKENNRIRFVPNTPAKDDEVRIQKPITPANQEAKAPAPNTAATEKKNEEGVLEVGSLIAYATKQAQPVYPPAARSMRTTGIVKVELTVDEDGNVMEVQHTSGPSLLQTAAADAVKRWKFRPFTRDGQPVRATGFVNFNFSL